MNKTELIAAVAEKAGLSKALPKETPAMLYAFIEFAIFALNSKLLVVCSACLLAVNLFWTVDDNNKELLIFEIFINLPYVLPNLY